MKKEVVFNTKFVTDALRQQGYNAYNAVEDLVDNALEKEVGATAVRINVLKNRDKLKGVQIADDGCGMSMAKLEEAMSFGSETGKDRRTSLGSYGAGMKTASLGISKCFSVVTKRADEDVINTCVFDINESTVEANGGKVLPEYFTFTRDEAPGLWKDFQETTGNAEHGTVVIIDDIDKGAPAGAYAFKSTLIKHLRRTYAFFLNPDYAGADMRDVIGERAHIFVDDKEIEYFDILGVDAGLGVERVHDEVFEVHGVRFRYIDFYMPSSPSAENDGDDYYGRSINHIAVNVARNGRFTAFSSRFGIYFDQHAAGYRALLLVDGDSDALLGATYRKSPNDSTAAYLDPDLKKALESRIIRGKNEATTKQKANRNTDPTCKDVDATINKVLRDMAKNPLLNEDESLKEIIAAAKKLREEQRREKREQEKSKEKKEKENTQEKEKKEPKPVQGELDPTAKKRRLLGTYKDLFDITMESNGPRQKLYSASKNEATGKIEIFVNSDHVYFDDVLAKEDSDASYYGWANIFVDVLSMNQVGYFSNEDKRVVIDDFIEATSSYLDSSVNGNRPEEQRV